MPNASVAASSASTTNRSQPVVIDSWMLRWCGVAAVLYLLATMVPLQIGLRKMESFDF